MQALLVLTLTLLPTAFWFWFFVRRDRHPEPPWLLARTFAWGLVAWVVAAALQLSLKGALSGLALLALTALTEETTKFLAAFTAAREPEFDEPVDGLVYAVSAALGFAVLENLAYGWAYGVQVAAWHGLVTTLAHALFSAAIGYALTRWRFGTGRWWLPAGVLASTMLHLVFNGLLTDRSGWWPLVILAAVLGLMYVVADRFYTRFVDGGDPAPQPPE